VSFKGSRFLETKVLRFLGNKLSIMALRFRSVNQVFVGIKFFKILKFHGFDRFQNQEFEVSMNLVSAFQGNLKSLNIVDSQTPSKLMKKFEK
jgi:hypothetical protein